jgi:DNA helicase-2/ATP-dependent DNA helicase PcrA
VVLDDKIIGMILVNEKYGKKYIGKNGPVYYGEDEYRKYYFTDEMKMYSDKIAKFVCRCEEKMARLPKESAGFILRYMWMKFRI